MVKNTITVFARVKPEASRKGLVNYKIHRRPKKHSNEDFLVLTAPQKFAEYIDNRPESWNFSFGRVFGHDVSQDDVFDSVARPVVNSSLQFSLPTVVIHALSKLFRTYRVFDGYNATIFAYGQTGSGKTYTITGEPGVHSERGILPRTLQYVFDIVRKNPENLYSVEVAYLEIYNENGYDLLLDRKQREAAGRLEDLPRVTIQEDESGTMHLKNLSFRIVENEKEALEYLVDGDMYRAISETPMNPRSSRSHCIFTIVVSVKKIGEDRYSRAKMHLVDLAGSERVYKCSIQGTILTEAKHINLSLHFLEQVIVCLGQDNVSHVPYRNSLLTSILRDSLGGNCLTTMLATLSVSTFNLEETISTCRFAQRVALVKNDVNLTFELDTKSENMLLRMENDRLRKQIEELKKQASVSSCDSSAGSLEYYKNLVVQRDQEISRLIDILKKERGRKKPAIKEGLHCDRPEVGCDQRSTQIPSSRGSPRTVYRTSPTTFKKRRHGNSLQGKAKMTPRRDESVSPKTTQKIQPLKGSPRLMVTEVPDLELKEDFIDAIKERVIQDSQDVSNVPNIDTKTERRETGALAKTRKQDIQRFNIEESRITLDQKSDKHPDDQPNSNTAYHNDTERIGTVVAEINRRPDTQTLVVDDLRIKDNKKSRNLPGDQTDSNGAHPLDTGNYRSETVVSERHRRRDTQTLKIEDSRINHDQKSKTHVDSQIYSDVANYNTKNAKSETVVFEMPRRQNTQIFNIEDSSINHNQKSKKLPDPEIDANIAYYIESTIGNTDSIASERHRHGHENTQPLNIEESCPSDKQESKKLLDSRSNSCIANHNSTKTDRNETHASENQRQQNPPALSIEELTTNLNTRSRQHPAIPMAADIASSIDTKTEGRETVGSKRLHRQNTQTLNTERSTVDDNTLKIKKSVDLQSPLANANLPNRCELSSVAQNSQASGLKGLISASDVDKAEPNVVPKSDKITMNEKSPREKGPGFPMNVMKMIRTSRNRRNEDNEETSSPKSGTPRSGFKAPSIIRNMLCRDKSSPEESPTRIEDKNPGPLPVNQDDPRISGPFKKSLPLTGDPEIDEEIIAFYKAKRSGGVF